MSKFTGMRSRWDLSKSHRSEYSPTIPLLHCSGSEDNSKFMSDADTAKPTLPVPGHSRRLTVGLNGMWNKQFTSIRNKAFSRASRHASSETTASSIAGSTMQAENLKSASQKSTKSGKHGDKMTRSQTTSFLPVPSKGFSRSAPAATATAAPPTAYPKMSAKHAKAISETRIPTPPRVSFTRPSYLPRSTTHPNLGGFSSGRRASEYSRRNSARWPLLEDTRPLLRSPPLESPMLSTPTADDEWFTAKSSPIPEQRGNRSHGVVSTSSPNKLWSAFNTPRRPSVADDDQENASSPYPFDADKSSSPLRSPRVIEHRKLLQPIQPDTPPSTNFLQPSSPFIGITSILPTRPVFTNRQNLQRPTPLTLVSAPLRSIHTVDKAQPGAYWSGRFVSLNDKFLDDSFDVNARPTDETGLDTPGTSTTSLARQTHHKGKQDQELRRAQKVFEALESICTSDEARRSLLVFRNMYAIKMKMPELRCEIPPTPRVLDNRDEILSSSMGSGGGGMSAGLRKMSFMGMLRSRKSSGKSILSLRD